MNYKFIIIAILIFLKIIGIASHAKADFSYNEIKAIVEKEHREWIKQWEYNNSYEAKIEKEFKETFEDAKTITNVDDYSYTAEYLNGKKEWCINNDFTTLDCVDYSLVSSSIINNETNKTTNSKISKEEEELILSMTLSTLFNITQS